MGYARWNDSDWARHSAQASQQTRSQIFSQQGLDPSLDPSKIKYRESADSDKNPQSTPIILAADETGSMGVLAEKIIKTGLGIIMKSIYDRKPVPDPHILCMGIGDANCDEAPLQVTQFEAGVEPLVEQIKKIWLEGNGGGNGGESYPLAWWFAAYKCRCDAFAKRQRKGYLFTIGDECPHPYIRREQVSKFLGVPCESDIPTKDLLTVVQQGWHVFHLIVKPEPSQPVVRAWKDLLAERAILVSDDDKLAEGIVSIIEMVEGASVEDVADNWEHSTALVVRDIGKQLVGAK